MPIRPPLLDDRDFASLRTELLARIPAHTPEWTAPRTGDPGVTMIELFAWLADTVLYRANLIPERQRLAFLALVGQHLRSALPATGIALLRPPSADAIATVDVPEFSLIEQPVAFETRQHAQVLPVEGRCFIKRRLDPAEARVAAPLLDQLQDLYGLTHAPSGYVTHAVFDPEQPAPAGDVDLAFDTTDRSLWIALLAGKPALVDTVRTALGGSAGVAARLNIAVVLGQRVEALNEDVSAPPKVAHRFEITGREPAEGGNTPLLPLDVEGDLTRGLARSGTLRLVLPAAMQIGAPSNDPRENARAGVGNNPPRLDDPALAARLVTWVRLVLTATPPLEHFAVRFAGVHAVPIEQRRSLPDRVVGTGDGASGQRFLIGASNVDTERLEVEVDDPELGRPVRWLAVDDVGSAQPDERSVEIDAEAGELLFGAATVPANGARVRVRKLRAGGGTAGNLTPGTLKKIALASGTTLKLYQPLSTAGGADAETLDTAERRIPAALRHRERVVTAEDYRDSVLAMPRGDVGRVEVLPRFKPHERDLDVPGVVSVMAWPARDGAATHWLAPVPRADRLLLEQVHAWLAPRRPLATELYAIGCEYVAIGAALAVRIADGHAAEIVIPRVRDALRRHLWPLPEDDHAPWPLGRAVDNRELEVVAARVEGVVATTDVTLFTRAGRNWNVVPAAAGRARIDLAAWQLPELVGLNVLEGDAAPTSPDDGGRPPGDDSIAVPIVPEVC